ncbi:MAG: BamA/TamA family outer membrane protein, partial [Planctomycetia bacterium]|nr:BamA/TamA family outer membrane protein [Planctomycetia bacterium]
FRPDGAAIAFAADPGGTFHLFILDLPTSAVTRVTDVPGGAFSPRWTPDGREIVFTVYRHGRFTTWSTPPRTAPAPAEFADPARAAGAASFTRGLIETYEVEPYESHIRFESILPTGARLSDILEHHRFDTGVDYKFRSGGYDLGMDVTYTNRSLRPDFSAGVAATTQRDSSGSDSTFGGMLGVSYPLDSSTRVSLELFAREKIRHEVSEADRDLPRRTFEDGLDVKVVRRNITSRRHNPISGYFVALQATVWAPWMGSDVDRVNYRGEGRLYLELWHDHVLAVRMAAIHSTGPDRDSLSLKDRVRAYDSGEPRGTDVIWANAEFRFPIWRDIDWVSPAELVLLKDLRGIVFTDAGVISQEENVMNMLAYPVREEWHWSAGVSLQFDLFLVERKYLPVIITLVKALDRTEEAPRGIRFEVNFELAF